MLALSHPDDVVTAVRQDVLAIPIIALTLLDPTRFERILTEAESVQDTGTEAAGEDVPAATEEEDGEPVEGVYVLNGERVRFRPVEVGIAGDNYFEVLSGLEEGETVVSGSYQAIRELEDGALVRIENGDEDGAPQGATDSEA